MYMHIMYTDVYIYIYIYMHMCIKCVYKYIYIYTYNISWKIAKIQMYPHRMILDNFGVPMLGRSFDPQCIVARAEDHLHLQADGCNEG